MYRFVEELLAAGVTLLQYRNKQGSAREILREARELRRIAGRPVTVTGKRPLLIMMLANPMDLARVALLLQFDVAALLGYTGAVMQKFFGRSVGIGATSLAIVVWIVAPLVAGMRAFQRKDF